MASITLQDLHIYHSIDRDIFSRLILNLERDAGQSLIVIALWLWLEENSYPSMTAKLRSLPDTTLAEAAIEAALCLKALESKEPFEVPDDGGLLLTTSIMERDISLDFFFQNKFTAIYSVKKLLNNVCARVFTDILLLVLTTSSSDKLSIPGFPHPTFGPITVVPRPSDYRYRTGALWGWDSTKEIPEVDRTMFLTFSRGFPVTENEVFSLFSSLYGDCVDAVQMEEVKNENDQPLFARLILRSVSTIDRMLGGKNIAKFKTNGKHIWARKYEPRERE